MSAAAAMSAIVVASKPRSANSARAARTIASRVCCFLRSRRPAVSVIPDEQYLSAMLQRTQVCNRATFLRVSSALARLARTLTHHWKRSLAAAVAVIVVLGVIAGTAGGPAADDFNIPGTESQSAIDLFRAHSKALAGADSTIVYTVPNGKVTDPGP